MVRIQHDGNHNPSSTQKLGKGGSPGEENSICSSGEVAEAEVQASVFTGGWSPWRPGYTPPLPSAGMWPRAAHQLLCTVPSSGASTVPGTQYVYRYSLSIYIYCIYMASPPQPGSSSIFHNSSRFFHPIFMIFSNSKESVPLLLLLFSRSVMSGSFATPWTVARQAPPFMEFSRQEYWSGLPCPPPGDLPNSGIEPASLNISYIGRRALYH